jgi:hypothetical protein
MATLNIPITYTQHSPYVRGTVTYSWSDTAAITAVSGFNSGANGISSVTNNLSSANVVVAFDSNSSATVDLTTCTSGAQLTVPTNYNKDITLTITADLQVGTVHSATTNVKKVLKHTFVGTSDSTVTSSAANPTFTEAEFVAGTTKDLGDFSVNDADSGATYIATMTYDKSIGSITYSDTSIVTSNPANDVITTSSVSTLNTVLSGMQYKPLLISSPVAGAFALQDQTLTLTMKNTHSSFNDDKINGQPTTMNATINNALSFAKSGSAPSFTETDSSGFDNNGKSLGTFTLSPTITFSGVNFVANVTYDKNKGQMTYPDASIVQSSGTGDTITTNSSATLNTALTNATYVPTTLTSGQDLEEISADTITIEVTTDPPLPITNSTQTVTTVVAADEEEISGIADFTYVENTLKTIFSSLQITDTADAAGGTNEVYAIVLKPTANTEINVTQGDAYSNTTTYVGTSFDLNNNGVSALNSMVIQGFKTELNQWLADADNTINYLPASEITSSDTMTVDVYRAPHGTAYNLNINNSSNFSTFKQIFKGDTVNIDNSGTVTTLRLQDKSSLMNYRTDLNTIQSETFVDATSWGAIDNFRNILPNPRVIFKSKYSNNIKFKVSLNTSLTTTEFGTIDYFDSNANAASSTHSGTFTAADQELVDTLPQGGPTGFAGGLGGTVAGALNYLSHHEMQDTHLSHNCGTLSAVSDEETATLTYTVSNSDDTLATSVSVPYLIVKSGSTNKTITTTGTPFGTTGGIISMWLYTPSTYDMIDSNGASTTLLFQAGDSNLSAHPYYIYSRLERSTLGGGGAEYQKLRFGIQQSSTEGFFGTLNLGGVGDQILNSNGWNHIIVGWKTYSNGITAQGGVNGVGGSFTGGVYAGASVSAPVSWATGMDTINNLTFAEDQEGAFKGHIQIFNSMTEGDVASSSIYGPKARQCVSIENQPSPSSGFQFRPTVRNDLHGFIHGDATSWRVKGNMGGSVSVTSGATGQALAPAPTGVSYATGSP